MSHGSHLFWIRRLVRLILSQQMTIRWRKPWGGPLVIRAQARFWQGQISFRSPTLLNWKEKQGSKLWEVSIPMNRLKGIKGEYLWCLRSHLCLQQVQGSLQIGLQDPALTGRLWGLIFTLPPNFPLQIQFSFSQIGWRSRGQIETQWQSLRLMIALTRFWLKIWVGSWIKPQVGT